MPVPVTDDAKSAAARAKFRLLQALADERHVVIDAQGDAVWHVPGKHKAQKVAACHVLEMISDGVLPDACRRIGTRVPATQEAMSWLRRTLAHQRHGANGAVGIDLDGDAIRPFRAQHEIVTGAMIEGRMVAAIIPGLAWLTGRGGLDPCEIKAAIWLRETWECAGAGGVRAVDFTRPVVDTSTRGTDGIDRLDAGSVLNWARAQVGASLWMAVESVVIRDLPMKMVEEKNGWPQKSGRVPFVLKLGLKNLAIALGHAKAEPAAVPPASSHPVCA
jgi:hypothetical protein